MTNHSLSLAVLRWQIMSYDFFITTFILSICMCDEPMWQSQTYKHARHFFSIFLSLSRAHTHSRSPSLPSLSSSVLFRLRRRMTMQHRAISIGRTYSTLTLFSSLLLLLLLLWVSPLFLSAERVFSSNNFVLFFFFSVFFSRIQTSCLSVEFSYGCWCFWWWHKHTHCAFHHIRVSSW